MMCAIYLDFLIEIGITFPPLVCVVFQVFSNFVNLSKAL